MAFDKKEYNKQYYQKNKKRLIEQSKQYYYDNREKRDEQKEEWRLANMEKCREYGKKSRIKNKDSISVRRRRYEKRRRAEDSAFNIKQNLRRRLRYCYDNYSDGKKFKSHELGIDWNAIIEHLGQCPGNREDYHIDHIRPLCSFDFNDPDQIIAAFAPDNHQWLLKEVNIAKGGLI